MIDKQDEFTAEFMEKHHILQEREASRRQALEDLALAKAADIARMLREKYGVGGIYLYGSLAWGGFGQGSDLDLFVSGFKGDFWRMYLDAEAIALPFELNLVCEEDAHPSLRDEVRRRGVSL